MKKLILLLCVVALAGCGSSKKATNTSSQSTSNLTAAVVTSSTNDKGVTASEAEGVCGSVDALISNYQSAVSPKDAASGQIAADQFRNALEAMKAFAPESIQGSMSTLRASDAPVEPSKYNEAQKAARAALDQYLTTTCGKKLP